MIILWARIWYLGECSPTTMVDFSIAMSALSVFITFISRILFSVHIWCHFVLWVDWSFYHYVRSFFLFSNFSFSEVHFTRHETYPFFFNSWLSGIIFPSFYFQSTYIIELKVSVSCKQFMVGHVFFTHSVLCSVYLDYFSSVQFSHWVVSNSLQPHESHPARPPCPSPAPRVYPNSCPSSRWCHPTISSSVIPFFSCPRSLPTSGSFPMSQLFAWGGQSIGVSASASVLPVNTQDWSPLG